MDKLKNYFQFYFDEDLYKDYHHFLDQTNIKNRFDQISHFDINNVNNKVLLNVSANADILDNEKLKQIQDICNNFNNLFFYFLSGTPEEGFCLKFPSNKNDIIIRNRDNLFYSFFSEYNFWFSDNWCRWVSGGYIDDIFISENKYINFSHELISSKTEDFDNIFNLYTKHYGIITPILEHKEFLKKIFKHDFNYLLSDNIYITQKSIEYINDQL
ncbi:hypothetical protein [Riemerella columbina]|uniref:hypothetical protein n=1 Tax=Riemerella columbina TaxID=103810 RepID=UPI00266FECB2|nr:hypothetical protein [Riemerella columbina]WKS95306.1 hypothetical protein NYR17_00780 [Riemerella columbina]